VIDQQPDKGVEFIDGAIGFDAQVTFGDFGTSDEGGSALIAGFCIDFCGHGLWGD
jgi:hypothetical protein